jgi:hypothetical protein
LGQNGPYARVATLYGATYGYVDALRDWGWLY